MTVADKRTAAFENIFGRPAAPKPRPQPPPQPASHSAQPDDDAPPASVSTARPAHSPLAPINTSLASPAPAAASATSDDRLRFSAPAPPPPVQRWSSNLTTSASSFDSASPAPSPLSPPLRSLYDAPAAATSSSSGGIYSWPTTTSPVSTDPYAHAPPYYTLSGESDRLGLSGCTASSSAAFPPPAYPVHTRQHSRSSSTATATSIPPTGLASAQPPPDPANAGVYSLSPESSRSSSFAWPSMYPGAPFSAFAAASMGGTPVDQATLPVLLAAWDQQLLQQQAPPQHHPPVSGAMLRGSRRTSDASSVLDPTATSLSSIASDQLRSTPRSDSIEDGSGSTQAYSNLASGSSLSRNSSAGSSRVQPWSTSGSAAPGSHAVPGNSGLRALTPYTSSHSSTPGSPNLPAPGSALAHPAPGLHHKSLPNTLQHHWDNITGRRRRSAAAGSSIVPPASGLTPTTGSPPPMSQAASTYSPHKPTKSLPSFPPSTAGVMPSELAKDQIAPKGLRSHGTSVGGPTALGVDIGNRVYPALVSHVARAFQERVPVSERAKDGLRYKDAFEGRAAVDKLCHIIRTSDRNLALLVGRALDAQKFFHDVTYDHRLRDSTAELYQFRVRLAPGPGHPLVQDDELGAPEVGALSSSVGRPTQDQEDDVPTGVFTLLTECYSPTCSPDRLCYSITCPRRLEQQARMHGRLPRSNSATAAPVRSALGSIPAEGRGRTYSVRSSVTTPSSLSSTITVHGRRRGTDGPASVDGTVVYHQDSDDDDVAPGALWAESVPAEVLGSVSEKERKRQELINEVVVTERNFVRDMEYLRNEWLIPLRSRADVIPEYKRDDFVTQLFWNATEILGVHQKFCEALVQRTKRSYVVDRISDIFMAWVPSFEPFVRYGAHQLYGKYEFEQEKATNPAFTKFVNETERRPAARKLELNGYLTKPVTRLSRYPLLLHQVLKYTPPDHPDAEELPAVIDLIKQLLSRVNTETGASANRFNLAQLDQQLVFKPGEAVDLRLRDPMRELVFRGTLKRRAGVPSSESAELQVFLFDHALLLTKPKMINKQELFKVTRKPMPLELLVVTVYDELPSTVKTNQTRVRTTTTRLSTGQRLESVMLTGAPKQDAKQGYALTLTYLGRKGYTLTLWASTYMARQKWFEQIEHHQDLLRARSNIFNVVTLHAPAPSLPSADLSSSDAFVPSTHGRPDQTGAAALNPLRATCAVPFDFGRRIIIGAQDGVYLSELRQGARPPTRVLPLANVTQIDVLEEYQVLLVLADRTLHTFLLDCLDPHDPVASLKRGRRIQGLVTFFRAGVCLGRTLVCVIKSSPLPSSTIRTLEPVAMSHQRSHSSRQMSSAVNGTGHDFASTTNGHASSAPSGSTRYKKRTGSQLQKLFPGSPSHTTHSGSGLSTSFGGKQSEALRVFKEFYIPMESTSVHFLKTKLCIAATKGFEIVDLDTLDTQALLDPADPSLDFVFRKEALKPIAIYRIHREFLLCYDEFAFYVNKTGWRARGSWMIHWEGHPTAFAFHYPYILAFEPSFIEVRHVGSGALHQIITGSSVKCLFSDIPPPPPPAQQAALRALYAQFNSLQLQQQQQQEQQQQALQHGQPYSAPPGHTSSLPVNGLPGTPPGARSNMPLPPTPSSGSIWSPALPATSVPVNAMWESAHASRTPIVFSAGRAVFYVRRSNAK